MKVSALMKYLSTLDPNMKVAIQVDDSSYAIPISKKDLSLGMDGAWGWNGKLFACSEDQLHDPEDDSLIEVQFLKISTSDISR